MATAEPVTEKCPDNCALKRERWERGKKANGKEIYRCSVCKRFIGYVDRGSKQ